jgi:hypothetical protein
MKYHLMTSLMTLTGDFMFGAPYFHNAKTNAISAEVCAALFQ